MGSGTQVWSQTAATNATADSAVNWAEGMAPSAVNDSARAQMASEAKFRDDNNGTVITTGSSAAFTGTSNQVSTGLVNGYTIALQFHATADASATYNHDTLGAKQLQLSKGTNLSGGEFESGSIHRFTYITTSTAWVVHGHEALTNNAVTTASITAGAVTGAKIADATINSTNLVDSTIATTKIANSAITYAKMQNVAASSIVANLSTSAAAPTEYALGNNLAKSGSNIDTKYGPKAWVTWTVSAATPTIQKSFNVTSVTRTAQGIYAIAFTSNMTDQYYAPMGIGQRSGSNDMGATVASTVTPATSGFSIAFPDSGGGVNDPIFASVVVFGN